jgi:2-octaprenyl-6-methoxyphenol hydroxylase
MSEPHGIVVDQSPPGSPAAAVVVAGAGPVGLAAALILDGLSYRVTIVAPARTGEDGRTSALLGGSVSLLERIGVWPEAAASAAPLRSLRIVDATRRLLRAPEVVFHASEIGIAAFGYNLPNRALIAALEAAVARRGILRRHAAVETLSVRPGAVDARLSDGGEIAAPLVVAADGRRSAVRSAVGIEAASWRYDQSALVVNFRHSVPHADTSTELHTESGPFTTVPLPGDRSSLVWVDRPVPAEARAALSPEALSAAIEERSGALLGTVAVEGPAQVFPLAGLNARRFAAGRAMLVGEAAHLFPPIGAQGLNLGYRDVAALGRVLAGPLPDPGAERVLAAYDRARRGDILTRTAAVDALNRTLLTGLLPVQAARGLGLFLLDRVPALRRAMMRQGLAAGL